MSAIQGSKEQVDLFAAQRIQAALPTLVETDGFAEPFQVVASVDRSINDGQGIEVTLVGGAGDLVVTVEIGHAFVHGAPDHLLASPAFPPAPHAKFAWLVDDRLDTQDQAEFVVHFQPIVLHAMLDTRTGKAIFLAVTENLAVEAGVQATTEESQDIGGR